MASELQKQGQAPAAPGYANAFNRQSGILAANAGFVSANDFSEDPELDDISKILNGARAITGKAVTSASRGIDEHGQATGKSADDLNRQHEQEEEERIAAWDQQMTYVGGVQMTNAEALRALDKINRDPDAAAKWAKERGLIQEGEEEEFKRTAHRLQELTERYRKGTLTDDERHEKEKIEKSRMGEAIGHSMEWANNRNEFRAKNGLDSQTRTGTSYTKDQNIALSSPAMNDAFKIAAANQVTSDLPKLDNSPEQNVQVQKNLNAIPGLG